MTSWRSAILGIAVIVVFSTADCAAPTLPIPPPTALVSSPDPTGYVTVWGEADPTAFVFVLRENTESGVITHATPTRAYSVRIQAALNDGITVWQEVGNRASEQLHLTVR